MYLKVHGKADIQWQIPKSDKYLRWSFCKSSKPLTIFAKSSIFHVRLVSECPWLFTSIICQSVLKTFQYYVTV